MKKRFDSLIGFVAYWVIFGGTSAALIGLDNLEFGNLCKLVLMGECLAGMIILLCVLAYYSPDNKPAKKKKIVYRDADVFRSERDARCKGYITPDEIRRAARNGRR